LANSSRESNVLTTLAISFEEVPNVWSYRIWSWNKNNIMLLRGADGIVVEMVDYKGIAVRRKMDIEFEEERNESRRGRSGGIEGQQNVAFCVDELEK
jgi:hypothetical protein